MIDRAWVSQDTGGYLYPLLEQVRAASDQGLYLVALMSTLAIPDICGALGSDNGRATGPKYRSWLVEHAKEDRDIADLIYDVRCSLLHQGSLRRRKGKEPARIAFVVPDDEFSVHRATYSESDGESVFWLSIPAFADELSAAGAAWAARYGGSATVLRNMENYVRAHPEGHPGFFSGYPVVI